MTTGESAVIAADLLNDLRTSKTDLARLVEAVIRNKPPYVVVPIQAVTSWERREPDHWARVSGWLADSNVSLVKV
jgi:predicted PhzF superfamily epimerase YddE/YHI9